MKSNVAIIIPIYKNSLTHYESISLKQISTVLADYPIIFCASAGLTPNYLPDDNYQSLLFFKEWDGQSVASYSQLLLSEYFYQQFENYTHILIAQLDTFVFRNELEDWANLHFDYIGAPWIFEVSNFTPHRSWLPLFHRFPSLRKIRRYLGDEYMVGNGGFSLRKVKTFLHILNSFKREIAHYKNVCQSQFHCGASVTFNEDVFWSVYVPKIYRLFKIPKFRTALRFAFEVNPQYCYELNNNSLPFGCHAWDKHGTAFWRPIFKEKYGYDI